MKFLNKIPEMGPKKEVKSRKALTKSNPSIPKLGSPNSYRPKFVQRFW